MKKAELENIRQTLIRLEAELHGLKTTSEDNAQPVELDQTSVGRPSGRKHDWPFSLSL